MSRRSAAGLLTIGDVARMIGRTAAWFRQNRKRLEDAGFPKRDDLLGGYHRAAVQAWLDARRGGNVAAPTKPADRAAQWATSS